MAAVDVGIRSEMTPEEAWQLASDLHRFSEWMTIFGGWKSEVPDEIDEGTEVSSLIKVKGFRNVIHWQVTCYEEPTAIALSGTGRGGVHIDLTMRVDEVDAGSRFSLNAALRGGLLNGPVGRLVARMMESDVRESIENLAQLGGTPEGR
ncbi:MULTISPECIES: type II toxin-antitoxin system Rv0910 family toxin [Gordonia]|uniref:SRPBCC family protein n=1 Tax=Gordonia tangerina TaxID=2911060 RepID=A0ABS9DQ29_9ACTN|nr:SRPBCC family protein [Gordonia tangerina]MCF3941335.1 SRPBCC family protein [Gordonia tangerina]